MMRTAIAIAFGLALIAAVAPAQLVVRAKKLYPISGPPIEDAVVVLREGKIAAVGPAVSTPILPGAQEISAAVVVPGLIDAHSVMGVAGWLNQKQDQDQLDPTGPIQPELRAIDAFNLDDPLVAWVRGFGVTTVHTGHAPGAVISGQTMIVKTAGKGSSPHVLRECAAVAATLGPGAFGEGRKSGASTRGKQAAILRTALLEAQEYQRKQSTAAADKKPDRNLRHETLGRVLAREVPLLLTAERAQDIRTALRLQEEFGFQLWLDGGSEATLLTEELVAAKVPIFLHPTMARAVEERANASFESAGKLLGAGLSVAFQSGFESYVPKTRVVLFEAAATRPHGVAFETALTMLTLGAARMLGIADQVGTIEFGKQGDLALFDGDPFEWTTHCLGSVVDGVFHPGEAAPR